MGTHPLDTLSYWGDAGELPEAKPWRPSIGYVAAGLAWGFVVATLVVVLAWLRLRDDQLTYQARELARLKAEVADLRGLCPARGHDAGGGGR